GQGGRRAGRFRARGATAGSPRTQPVGKGLAMKKLLSLAFVAMLFLVLAAPASAGRGHGGGFHGGGFHGGHHGGFHHGGAFHRGCCWGGAFVGAVFVGSAFVYPYYAYPYYAYPYYRYNLPISAQPVCQLHTEVPWGPFFQGTVFLPEGCFLLQGDGVRVAYSWIGVPAAPAPPPSPPSR